MKTVEENLALANETFEFYEANPRGRRSYDKNGCMYISPTGKMCAVGRMLTDTAIDHIKKHDELNVKDSFCLISDLKKDGIDQPFEEEYQGFNDELLDSLQSYHDIPYAKDRLKKKIEILENIKKGEYQCES